MNEQPTHLDLFSGIGGFALSAGWAGFKTVGFCEIDPYCQAVLRKHWPQVPIHTDIKELRGGAYRGCSLLTGGFPCQPFSQAGKRRGKDDDRHLWPQMLRIIEEAQPRWIVGENVVGIINMELDKVCADLERIGYEVQSFVIPACAVDAPHRRDRIWIVGNAKLNGLASAETSGGLFHKPKESGGQITKRQFAGTSCSSEYVAYPKRDAKRSAYRSQIWQRGRENAHILEGDKMGSHSSNRRPHLAGNERSLWATEPELGRLANGIPSRISKLKALGNAIVPQVAFPILEGIRKLIKENGEN